MRSRKRRVWRVGPLLASAVLLASCSPPPPAPTTLPGPCVASPPSFDLANYHPCWLAANVDAGGTPTRGGTLRLEGYEDVTAYFDPQGEYEPIGDIVESAYTRQLVTYDVSTNLATAETIVPDAATSMPAVSSDGLTYTFHIKPGVMWNTSPARQVTSLDFERGIERTCDPTLAENGNPVYYTATIEGLESFCSGFEDLLDDSSAPARAAYLNSHGTHVSGIQTPNSSTISFTLVQPATDFLNILALPFASAAPVEDLAYVPLTPSNPVYSDGPYEIKQYVPGQEIELDRNSAWNQSTDALRHDYVNLIDINTAMRGSSVPENVQSDITNGIADLEWDTSVPVNDLDLLTSPWNPLLGVFPEPGNSNPFVAFNVLSPNNNGALGKIPVRQALEYAIDKVAMGTLFGGSTVTQPLNQVLGPGAQGFVRFDDYPTPGDRGDPATCKRRLKAAGYPNGLTLIDVYKSDLIAAVEQFDEVKSDFAKCGVTVRGLPVPSANFFGPTGLGETESILKSGTWDFTSSLGWIPDWVGPTNARAILPDLFSKFGFPIINVGDYDSQPVDTLIGEAETAKTPRTAANLWHQADELVMSDAPFIPIQTVLITLFHSERVHNAIFSYATESYNITQVWLSP